MIKSVSFKDPAAQSLQFGRKLIHKDELTPKLYMTLVGIDPKISDQFNVEMENSNETNKAENNGETKGTTRSRARIAENSSTD